MSDLAKVAQNRSMPRAALAGGLVFFLAGLASPTRLSAQFSGPALGVTAQPNRAQTPTTDPAVLLPASQDLEIVPGDSLLVRVFGAPEFAPPAVGVPLDGNIQLPLIGSVQVAGLTVRDAQALIAERLESAGMYVHPQVSVGVSEAPNQFATVSGEMHGIVPLNGSRRLLDVLAVAGNLPPTASHTVTILREGVEKPIVVDLGTDPTRSAQANIPILPRDTILIARVGVVYILGAFKLQGAIPLQQNSPLTLMQATALSGGAGFEGRYKDLRIIRTVGLERKFVQLDIQRIIDGKNPDPVLQADDIVFLPSNALKAAIKGGGIGTISSLASVLLFSIK